VSAKSVRRYVRAIPGFPGSRWRFLKAALLQWLSQSLPRPSEEAQLAGIGSWKDDPCLDEMLQDNYRKRQQRRIEEGE
jgi:hypothetical protein